MTDLSAALARVAAARRFPHNTDAASRYVEFIAEIAPEHDAISMLSVVASLYEARNEVGMLDRLARKSAIDAAEAIRRQAEVRNLIAAAPDLFEALDACEAAMSIVEPRSNKAQYLEVLEQARAALKKAKRDA